MIPPTASSNSQVMMFVLLKSMDFPSASVFREGFYTGLVTGGYVAERFRQPRSFVHRMNHQEYLLLMEITLIFLKS